jgi:hypothetical protein
VSQSELLKAVVAELDAAGTAYMLTGSLARFARRIQMDWEGGPVWTSSPEDTILAKLRWAEKLGLEEIWTRLQNSSEPI